MTDSRGYGDGIPGVLMRLRLKGALRLKSVENLSTGSEVSATGESLNSGDPAVHPAARHTPYIMDVCILIMRPFFSFRQKSLFIAGRTSIGCQK